MSTLAMSAQDPCLELVVYQLKESHKDQYPQLMERARKHINKFPGLLDYQTYNSVNDHLLYVDIVKWANLEYALEASKKVQQMTELKEFMGAFESITLMEHFYPLKANVKIDLTKQDENYYTQNSDPVLIQVRPYNYLMIAGISAPEDPKFNQAIEAIYKVAYGVKFTSKAQGHDFVVPKMEAQWWVDGALPFEQTPRAEWRWNILIPMPEFVTSEQVNKVIADSDAASSKQVKFEALGERDVVQILHRGSYEEEGPSLAKIFQFIESEGLSIAGHHREIYLNDPRKTAEEKLRTIIRYPVK